MSKCVLAFNEIRLLVKHDDHTDQMQKNIILLLNINNFCIRFQEIKTQLIYVQYLFLHL